MSIYDDINNCTTVEQLATLYQTEFTNFQNLRTQLNDKSSQRQTLSTEIEQIKDQLDDYGKPKDVKDAFYHKLGELRKDDLNG